MARYLDVGNVFYEDILNSSSTLFSKLQARKTGAVGTVRQDRKYFPAHFRPKNLPLQKGDTLQSLAN